MTLYTPDQIAAETHTSTMLGTYYAWGRMDQGHEAIVPAPNETKPSQTYTAHAFGTLYGEQQKALLEAMNASGGMVTFGVVAAWENFVASGGATLDFPPREVRA